MIYNSIICMIFIPRIVFAWFQTKRSDIEWLVVMVITVNESKFNVFWCSYITIIE